MIVASLRQGIGIDIEYNEDICHLVEREQDTVLYGFSGVIILLPFLKIYIGSMDYICHMQEETE